MAFVVRTNLNPDLIPAIQNFSDFAFWLDGENIPWYCNHLDSWDWMHKNPTTTPTETHNIPGEMSAVAGGYKYFFTEINLNSGPNEWTCHETNPSPISIITGNFTNKRVTIILPSTAINSFTTNLKIYGTMDGGNIFYYLGKALLGITTFEDNNIPRDVNVAFGKLTKLTDGTITQAYLNYAIRNHCYLTATKSRIMVCGIKPITAGTANFTNGLATITGSGTNWTRAIIGDYIKKETDTKVYEIGNWVSATEITLATPLVYSGTTSSGSKYEILGIDDIIRWTARHPKTAFPMWWAFPINFYRRLISKDYSPIKGINRIGNQPVVFKEHSHFLLTESGDDFLEQESRTKVGTCSHWSIVETGESGTLIFMTYEGLIYETTGVEARDLGIDLSKTRAGINKTRLNVIQARWLDEKKWYILIYSSKDSSVHDRILIYDYGTKEWIIWNIEANCIAVIEDMVKGQKEFKPWIGSIGGFVYKMLSDNASLGTGIIGTLKGTITEIGADYINDSNASFYRGGNGHKDIYLSLYDKDGAFREKQKIISNTTTQITVSKNWTSFPQVGWSYEIGNISWYYKSKVLNFDIDQSKTVKDILMNFEKVAIKREVEVKVYISEDSEMPDNEDQIITFDLSQDYYEPLSCFDNRCRYLQYELSGHGVNEPVTISSIALEIESYLR
jgi:hypothetical protein